MPVLDKVSKQFEQLLIDLVTLKDGKGVRVFENHELDGVVHRMRTVLRTAEDRLSTTSNHYRLQRDVKDLPTTLPGEFVDLDNMTTGG